MEMLDVVQDPLVFCSVESLDGLGYLKRILLKRITWKLR